MQYYSYRYDTLNYIREKARKNGCPVKATFEITPRCNFNCRMCYVHLPEEEIRKTKLHRELNAKEWLEIGKQCQNEGVLMLCITGGDPLSHPEFKEIWTGLSQMGFLMTLQTNAAFIGEELLNLFNEYPPFEVKITIYGSNNDVYKRVCKVENGFTLVDNAIQNLTKLKIPVQLVTTVVRQNIDDIRKIALYAKNLKLPWKYSTACYPSLRGVNNHVDECALDVWDLGCASETGKEWKNHALMNEEKLPCEYCSDYRIGFSITWDGDMRLCLLLNQPHISVLSQTVSQAWKQLLLFCERVRWPEKCYQCEMRKMCRRCLAHLACLNGGIGKVSGNYCHKVEEILAQERST